MAISESFFENASIELVIFDCDGVLIDSEILSKRVLVTMLKEQGVIVSDEYFETYFLGQSYASVRARIQADFSVELADSFRQDYLTNLLQVFDKELKPTDKLEEMLAQLKVRNCIATSSSPERVKFALNITGLNQYFGDRVFTSSEVRRGKPAPDLFLHTASKMNVAPEKCLVIEDSQAGIIGAKAANMHVLKYAGASHLKDKGISNTDIANNVYTMFDWSQFFELFQSLNSSS